MKKYIVTLTEEEHRILGELTSKGEHKSQKILDALTLLGCDEGEFQKKRSTNEEISRVLNTSMRKIDRVKKRFVEEGLDVALNRRKGSRIYAKKADGDFEAHKVRLIPQDSRALPAAFLQSRPIFTTSKTYYEVVSPFSAGTGREDFPLLPPSRFPVEERQHLPFPVNLFRTVYPQVVALQP